MDFKTMPLTECVKIINTYNLDGHTFRDLSFWLQRGYDFSKLVEPTPPDCLTNRSILNPVLDSAILGAMVDAHNIYVEAKIGRGSGARAMMDALKLECLRSQNLG